MDMTTLHAAIIRAVYLVFFLILFRRGVRFGWKRAAAILFLYEAGTLAIQTAFSTGSYFQAIYLIGWYVLYLFMITQNRANQFTGFIMWERIFNVLGSAVFGVIASILSAAGGQLKWYVRDQDGVVRMILMYACYIIAAAIAYLIIKKAWARICSLSGKMQKLMILLFPVLTLLCTLVKDLSPDLAAYQNNPSGYLLYVDLLSILSALVGFVILIVYAIRARKRENQKMQEKIDADYESYGKIKSAQDEIHELNHELRNLTK